MDNRTIDEIRENETKLIQEIKELENINDKLSSALNSAEQRIDRAIKYIESATIVESSSVHFRNTLFKILQVKE